MQPRKLYPYIYLVLGIGTLFAWPFVQNAIWPTVRKPKAIEQPAFVAGGLVTAAIEADALNLTAVERRREFPGLAGGALVAAAIEVKAPELVAAERRKSEVRKQAATELVSLGHGSQPFHLQVLLNSQGASIQQVVLTHFQQADREGLPVVLANGNPKPLHLIPGVRVPRTAEIRAQREVPNPELLPGKFLGDPEILEHPSFVMNHYEREADERPVNLLGLREWKLVKSANVEGDVHEVSFETELGYPHFVKITKTYTLKRSEYHVGLSLTIAPHNRPEKARMEPFRYQIDGPRNIPIEGEWYTSTYRQGVVGWVKDGTSSTTRTLEDARDIRHREGSDRHASMENRPIRYAGIMVQYFGSVLAVDDQAANQKTDILQYVRFTPQGETHKEKTFLDDLTFRAISKPIADTTQATTHSYVLYQGPVKVRLLKQLTGVQEVPEETVNRYRDSLHLRTLTDAPMPNFMGRFAHFIFWTDLVILFTNIIHSILGLLSTFNPWLGLSIVIITVMVRGALHPFSRRQSINAKIMQEKQAKLAPEVKKLTELYGSDFQKLNQEKMKLYKEHGIHPAAAMGGCVLVLAQMPVFMGLYYALQESIFFRLESFLWMPNLAAPDMLVWWTEKIPFISHPDALGSTVYLGPYLNLLPLIAVSLMMYTQSKMLPQSDDPQVQMQQKTMKIMMVMMAFFFYKVAAGLCIYFICSSLWGMIERKMLPKTVPIKDFPKNSTAASNKERLLDEEPKGWWGKKKAVWRGKWQQVLAEAQKQQELRRDDNIPNREERDRKRKKKR